MKIKENKYEKLGLEIGILVDKKNIIYGNSFSKAGDFLKILYPNGLSIDQYDDALLICRMFDKLMRIATDKHALGESPFFDLAGYSLLGEHMTREKQKSRKKGVSQK